MGGFIYGKIFFKNKKGHPLVWSNYCQAIQVWPNQIREVPLIGLIGFFCHSQKQHYLLAIV
jgi:hypothetical protein